MSVAETLFVLRLISGLSLLLIIGTLFYMIWRDYQGVVNQLHANRRVYGHLITLQKIDGNYIALGTPNPLLPLTSIGRSPTNTIVIDDSFASSEHALIIMRDGQWWLKDRQSRNGTLLNELPIKEATIMTDGDIVGIGNFRLRLDLTK